MIAKVGIMEMGGSPYKLSFTAGGLLLTGSVTVAEEYARQADWKATIESVRDKNLLQARTASAGNRVLREIRVRLQSLTDQQLALVPTSSRADQQHLLWLAVCKRYRLLHDFATEVIHNKFLELDLQLKARDFDEFLDTKAIWYSEIEALATTTRAKLRQVALRMIREADIVSTDGMIQPVVLATEVARAIQGDSASHFNVFPVAEADIRRTLA